MKIEEIKTYKCSDGAVFDSKDVAEAHEADLKDPNYMLTKRIEDLEKKIQHLEAENLKRIAEIETVKHPFGILNNKEDKTPWMPKVYYAAGDNVLDAIDKFFNDPQIKGDRK